MYLKDYCISSELITGLVLVLTQYYESLLLELKEENEREIFTAKEKVVSAKAQKLQAKLDKCLEEKMFLDEVST